jgi:hypothetical protein
MPKKMPKSKFKMPNEVVVIKNEDKDTGWVETWDSPPNRSPANIPHSFRCLALGGVSKGKSNYMKNIFLAHQSSSVPFKRLFVITCDLNSKEWDDCEPDLFTNKIPPLSCFQDNVKTMVVIDDYEFQKCGSDEKKRLFTLFRMISSHRGVSILASYQSFFDCPKICRVTSDVFIIYKPRSKTELKTIANRIGIDADDLKHMFKKYCVDHYDMLMFDMTKGSPYPVRKNIFEIIDYDSDSD